MKKLNEKQLKQIKAGRFSLTGALFNGIGTIIKSTFDGVSKLVGTVGTLVMGFQEAGKHHAKMSFKVGDSGLSFDDTSKVRAASDLAESHLGHQAINTANPKNVVLVAKPKVVDVTESHDSHIGNHNNEISHALENGMHMIDEFMHF